MGQGVPIPKWRKEYGVRRTAGNSKPTFQDSRKEAGGKPFLRAPNLGVAFHGGWILRFVNACRGSGGLHLYHPEESSLISTMKRNWQRCWGHEGRSCSLPAIPSVSSCSRMQADAVRGSVPGPCCSPNTSGAGWVGALRTMPLELLFLRFGRDD